MAIDAKSRKDLEVKIIREAMRTRGANSIFAPAVLYRSFVIPLVLRLVNISDTLSLSVETRGFTFSKEPYTIYRPPRFSLLDVLPILLLALGMTGVILL